MGRNTTGPPLRTALGELRCAMKGLHVFGYNSTESEPISMKFGKL